MSALERRGLWGWSIAGVVAAALLYFLVIGPFARTSFQTIVDELAQEDTQP